MISVVTSITAGKDDLIDEHVRGEAEFVAFVDRAHTSTLWKQIPAYDKFHSPRRNSRIHKILIHQYVNTKYSIWIDGNLKLLVAPEFLVETYLKDHDMALFRHPSRRCLYDEALVCEKSDLDDPETIIEQVKKYEDEGYPKNVGLCECNLIIRRHTPKVEAFNNFWWSEHCRHSVRDQISFMYALDKAGLRINKIDAGWVEDKGRYTKGNVIEYTNHLTPRYEDTNGI